MIDMHRIQDDLIGLKIVEDFIITSVSIDSSINDKEVKHLQVDVVNVKTNEQAMLREMIYVHGVSYNFIKIFSYPFYNILHISSSNRNKIDIKIYEHGIIYDLNNGYLKLY